MKVVVTGGSGFIGSHLVDRLIELGHTVISVDKQPNKNPNAIGRLVDINDRSHTVHTYEGIDYVFHLAGQPRVQSSISNPQNSILNNLNATAKVLELSKQAGVKKVIYSSTSAIYGMQSAPQVEAMQPNLLNPYAVAKLAGEHLCQVYYNLHDLDTVSLRYFNVYGPREPDCGQYTTVIKKFMDLKLADKVLTITGDGEQRRDFIHVSDVVTANIAAMQSEAKLQGEVLNIGSGTNHSINEIAKMISTKTEYIPERRGEARETLADIAKAKLVLDWEPTQSVAVYIKESL